MSRGFFCAIRGPIMLITLGTLFAVDNLGPVSFTRTWPALLIVFGVLKLAEHLAAAPGPPPLSSTMNTPPMNTTMNGPGSGGVQN
jgi:hypothetical protein